ncbi:MULTISPECIES: hypothetical protein [Bifidobacterium]|nr:hypothetical protein [Bifidobacterium tibiigranuli]MCH3975947.1 hypothetical protein [Bifidobacterium tibiigranuli]MCH4204424.1 hypothetical protein [Bifidobacterium tibiigranuli]MCH4275055.1 hypothetical protein [Bifidobacterium tibiigranuli]MCI1211894.1 hypothetical protein [Bifidobacterium tibiigranuli]MCI1221955.1 hypothetical protein [Bifidobacterium tibiigranuli]
MNSVATSGPWWALGVGYALTMLAAPSFAALVAAHLSYGQPAVLSA